MSTTSSTPPVQLSGLASGIDWTSIVNELLQIESAPITQMQSQQSTDQNKGTAYQGIGNQLTTLSNDITTLSDPTFFSSRTATSSNTGVANATAATGTPLGNFTFNVSKLATDAVQVGAGSVSAPLSTTNNVSSLQVGSAGFATPVKPGTFTVNGKTITIASTDTLQSVFDQINTQTGGAVTGSYNPSTDEITLNSSSPIVLGSATDTSNFLQSAELFNNGTGTITSTTALGGVNLSNPMSQANFATPITGSGSFLINGVSINYDASSDSVNDVLQRINDSSAGVTATYDSINDRFDLTNKTTGDIGISMQDVGSGNFLAATGLSGGTLQRGTNLLYSINGGGTQVSQSNTVSGTSSGVNGLSITATGTGNTTISVGTDTSKISSTITSFVNDYNAAQSFIQSQTATTTSSNGTVTPGILTGDLDAEGIADQLRHFTDAVTTGSPGGVSTLTDMGINSNGQDNTLTINTATLNTALTNNLSDVQNLFTNATNGIATQLNTYLTNVNGPNGALASDEANMTKEYNDLQTSITTLQQKITNDQTRLTNEFTQMETAIESINTQKQFLTDEFGGSSTTSAPSAAGSTVGSSSSATG